MSLAIFNKIQEFIRAKIQPDADPQKVLATDLADILEGLNSEIEPPADATATESGLMSAVNFKKALQLPTVNFDEFEVIEAPKLSIVGSSLNSTAGSVKYLGTVYPVPAATNLNGGLASFVNKQFFGYIVRVGTTFTTFAGLTDTLENPILDDITPWLYVYFGFYKYTGGILTQIPITPTLSAKLPGGETAVASGNGVLDLTGLDTGSSFAPIAEDEFGTHPAFSNLRDTIAYLLSGGTVMPLAAPTDGTENDTDDTFTFTLADL